MCKKKTDCKCVSGISVKKWNFVKEFMRAKCVRKKCVREKCVREKVLRGNNMSIKVSFKS